MDPEKYKPSRWYNISNDEAFTAFSIGFVHDFPINRFFYERIFVLQIIFEAEIRRQSLVYLTRAGRRVSPHQTFRNPYTLIGLITLDRYKSLLLLNPNLHQNRPIISNNNG